MWQVQSQSLKALCCLPTYTHKSQIKWRIFLEQLLHAQVELHERLTLTCAITVGSKVQCLVQPLFYIGLLGATGCCDGVRLPVCMCVSTNAEEHELMYCRAGRRGPRSSLGCSSGEQPQGELAVAKCCQEAELRVRWGGLLLMSTACLLTA